MGVVGGRCGRGGDRSRGCVVVEEAVHVEVGCGRAGEVGRGVGGCQGGAHQHGFVEELVNVLLVLVVLVVLVMLLVVLGTPEVTR